MSIEPRHVPGVGDRGQFRASVNIRMQTFLYNQARPTDSQYFLFFKWFCVAQLFLDIHIVLTKYLDCNLEHMFGSSH